MSVSCIFCGTIENLTTSMNVKTARGESTVHICSEHEDNASPKKVRELVERKEVDLAEMEAKLKALGFAMVPLNQQGSLTVVTAPPPAPPSAAKVLGELKPVVKSESKIVQPTSLKVRDVDVPDVAIDKTGNKVNLGKESSYDTSKTVKNKDGSEYRAPVTVESELQVVEVRGVPMKLPKKIVDDTGGQLNIKVLPTAGASDKFKRQFEDMAARSMADQGPDFTNKGSYEAKEPRECNFCGGTGKAKIGDQTCPRCKGAGEIAL